MTTIALVSILGPDRIGLVAAIADHLYATGINLRDVSFAALGTGVPVVYRSIGDLSTWNSDWLRRWRTRVLLGRTAAVVVLTERAVPPLTKFAVPAERVVVIPNGVPEIDYPLVGETVRSRARAELGLGAVPVAAFVGALEPEKDAATAIRTVALTQGFHLIVAGDGRERTNLERLALQPMSDASNGKPPALRWARRAVALAGLVLVALWVPLRLRPPALGPMPFTDDLA